MKTTKSAQQSSHGKQNNTKPIFPHQLDDSLVKLRTCNILLDSLSRSFTGATIKWQGLVLGWFKVGASCCIWFRISFQKYDQLSTGDAVWKLNHDQFADCNYAHGVLQVGNSELATWSDFSSHHWFFFCCQADFIPSPPCFYTLPKCKNLFRPPASTHISHILRNQQLAAIPKHSLWLTLSSIATLPTNVQSENSTIS
jgi:hypothetical protein